MFMMKLKLRFSCTIWRMRETESAQVRGPRLISEAWKWISSLPAVSKWSSSFTSATKWRTVKFSLEMVSKIDEISARLDDILAKKEILKLHKSNRRRIIQANERLLSTSLVNEARVYGREEDKEVILRLLETTTTHDVNVVVIPSLAWEVLVLLLRHIILKSCLMMNVCPCSVSML
ncbi:hypothetical protein M5689_022040 [Euphorbia peplus]|nr:hypothetical protein M5689_022040 [Euphorbia peplus]